MNRPSSLETIRPRKATAMSDRARIVWLWETGMSARHIARDTGSSVTTVYRWIRRWREERNLKTKPRTGRPRALTWQNDISKIWGMWLKQLPPTGYIIVMIFLSLWVSEAKIRTGTSGEEWKLQGFQALRSVFEVVPRRECAFVFLTDEPDIQDFVINLYDLAPWGVGVFEMKEEETISTNSSEAQFIDMMTQARKFRQLSRCISVIVISNNPSFLASFAEGSLRGRLLVWATRLVVITSIPVQMLSDLFSSHWTFSMMNAMVVVTEGTLNKTRCVMYAQIPYSPRGSHLLRLASWSPRRGLHLLTHFPLFPDKFSNFYGARVNVSAKDYRPYWIEMEEVLSDGSVTKKLSGMDYLLLETVANALNFTISVTPIASWAESLDNVVSKQSFITPVIHAVLRKRLERFDFTIPYTYASFSISMRTPGLAPKWQSLYYPLSGMVWLSVGVTTCIVVLVMLAMNKVDEVTMEGKPLDPNTTILEIIGILLGENLYKTLPTASSRRLVLTVWLIFNFIMGSVYTGNLTAALTLPKYPPRPETLEALVRSVRKVTMEPWGKDYKTFFKDSGSEVFMKLADLMELGPDLLFGLNQATEKNTAHMDARAVLQLNIAEHFTNADGTTPLYVVRESAISGMSAWPIPHDAPFKKNLDWCIRASLEAGLYDKWENDMLELARKESRERQRRTLKKEIEDEAKEDSESLPKPLTVIHMQGPLILLLLGLLLGALVFLMEMTVSSGGCGKDKPFV